MKRAILTLLSVLVFCNVVSGNAGYETEISWFEGVSSPDFSISPADPTITDLIYFTLPTDTFPDQLAAEEALGGTATLSIEPATRTIRLRFQQPPSAPFSEFAPSVSGLEGYFGPLEEGTWLFDVQFPGTFWQVDIDVGPGSGKANFPYPDNGAFNVTQSLVLRWRAGYGAILHDVYFGTNRAAVANGDPSTFQGSMTLTSFSPGPIEQSTTYYWRIDEVGGPPDFTVFKGDVWSFTTADFIVNDDFESYDKDNRISDVWTEVGGATVGYSQPPYVDREIVFYGKQSMPLTYSNTETIPYSATRRTFNPPQDWTGEGNDFLLMYVHGRPGNDRDQLYVEIGDSAGRYARVFNTNQNIVRLDEWIPWRIPLSEFTGIGQPGIEIPGSINLRQVTSITIGIGKPPDGKPDGLNNDNWFDAHSIGNVSNLEFDTTHATNDGYDNNIDGPNIWFCYTAPCNGPVTVSLCGSSYDTKLDIYDDCYSFPSWETSIPGAYNDDFCDRQSQVTFGAIKDHKYLIEVGGYDDHAGRGQLSIWCGLSALIESDFLSAAGPVGPIQSKSPAVAHVGKKVSDISYKADLPSTNLSDGLKLLADDADDATDPNEGTINIDPVITVGKDFAVLRGTVTSSVPGRIVENVDFTFSPIDYEEYVFPDGSYVVLMLQANFYRVTVIADHYRKILNRLVPCDKWDNVEDFEMDPE